MTKAPAPPVPTRNFFGLSKSLFWGYVAIAFFMTGDGLEQAFLSDYLVNTVGFSTDQVGTIFTVYGLMAAIPVACALIYSGGKTSLSPEELGAAVAASTSSTAGLMSHAAPTVAKTSAAEAFDWAAIASQ